MMTLADLLALPLAGTSVSIVPMPGGFKVTLEQGSKLLQVGSARLDDALVRAFEVWGKPGDTLEMHHVGCESLRGRSCSCSFVPERASVCGAGGGEALVSEPGSLRYRVAPCKACRGTGTPSGQRCAVCGGAGLEWGHESKPRMPLDGESLTHSQEGRSLISRHDSVCAVFAGAPCNCEHPRRPRKSSAYM